MTTQLELTNKSKDILKWFMEVCNEFPDAVTTQTGDDTNCKVYFRGNRTMGSEYELTGWQHAPILHSVVLQYNDEHPTKALQYFLSVNLNFRGQHSLDELLLNEEDFKRQARIALDNACSSFLARKAQMQHTSIHTIYKT